MVLTDEWNQDWDEIGTDHVFENFRGMVCHLYYRHAIKLSEFLFIIQNTHPMVTHEKLVEQFQKMDLPLRKER